MFRKNLIALLVLAAVFTFNSCDKDDPVIPNEEELITTVNYMLAPSGGGDAITLSFLDLDGDGGETPTITGGTLAANETYTGTMELLNEAESPSEDITEEIQEEDEEHQFFFQTDIAGLSVAYNDQDADGRPVGLSTTLTTTSAASGNITITLRHEPVKDAAGVADGDITNADGETDIEITFPINVQ